MEIEPVSAGLAEQICEVVSAIFENMLGLPANPDRFTADAPMELSARVGFSGSWIGLVILETMRQDARCFAARFLSMPCDRIDDRIAGDVLGELTNMVAGNLKPLFALDIDLSGVEFVPGGDEPRMQFVPAVCEELLFHCAEGSLVAKVFATPTYP